MEDDVVFKSERSTEQDVKDFLENPVWLDIRDSLDEIVHVLNQALATYSPITESADILRAQGQILLVQQLRFIPESMLESFKENGGSEDE